MHYSLDFVVLNLFNLGTERASQWRDSLAKPTAVTVLIRAPAGIVKFSSDLQTRDLQPESTERAGKMEHLKLLHENKMLL